MESKECMRSNNLLFDRTTDIYGRAPKLGRIFAILLCFPYAILTLAGWPENSPLGSRLCLPWR
jgi:hypothetical protein